jgi:hypothetical protein
MIHDRPHHLAQRRITYLLRRALGDLFLGPYSPYFGLHAPGSTLWVKWRLAAQEQTRWCKKPILRNGFQVGVTARRRSCSLSNIASMRSSLRNRKHALQLAIEVDLVAGETSQPVGIDGLTECLCAD